MEELEKSNENLLAGAQSELRKEMAMLQKKIMMDTVSVRSIKKLVKCKNRTFFIEFIWHSFN